MGVNLLDLEHHVRGMIKRHGAESCYWDYAPYFGRGPFRNVICLSVNDAVLHGLPHNYTLRDGDVLSADLAVSVDGWMADSARTVVVGAAAEEDLRIIRATEEALEAAIEVARPGKRLGDISAVAHDYGYPVNTERSWKAVRAERGPSGGGRQPAGRASGAKRRAVVGGWASNGQPPNRAEKTSGAKRRPFEGRRLVGSESASHHRPLKSLLSV